MKTLDCNGYEIKIGARVKCYRDNLTYDGVVKDICNDVVNVNVQGLPMAFFANDVDVYAMSWTAYNERKYQESICKK